MKQDLPDIYIDEYEKFDELFKIGAARTSTGNLSFTSTTSQLAYNSTTGEEGLLALLKTKLDDYLLLASNFNNAQRGVNVKDFGAKGDGIHDDTEAIQAAIDSLISGGTLFFPTGKYVITNTLTLSIKGLTLIGSGIARGYDQNGAVLIQNNPTMTKMIDIAARGVRITNMGFYGDNTSNTIGIDINEHYATIDNCGISFFNGYGIRQMSKTVTKILDNLIYQNKYGVYGSLWDSHIKDNDIGYGDYGIYTLGGVTYITNNHCWLQNINGIYLDDGIGIVIGNNCQNSGRMGIHAKGNHSVIKGNNCLNCGQDTNASSWLRGGIYIVGSDNICEGNMIMDNQATKTTLNGIEVGSGGFSNNVITGNNVSDIELTSNRIVIATDATNTIRKNNIGDSNNDVINVKDFGARGDGTTDDTVAIQTAITAGVSGTVYFPKGNYKVTSTLNIGSPINIQFASTDAKIIYTGSGDAVKISNQKYINWQSGTIDISGATNSPVAIHIAGLWNSQFYAPNIVLGSTNSTGVLIETSSTGGNNWGSYIIQFYNPIITGTGGYCFRTKRTTSDTVGITHLNVYGGWFKNANYGYYLENVLGGEIDGTACESHVNDGIYLANCTNVILKPGELVSNGGWGMNFDAGATCKGITVIAPNRTSSGGTSGFMNDAVQKITLLDRNIVRLLASNTAQNYFAEIKSDYVYGKSFILSVQGGGTAKELMTWGDVVGLKIDSGAGGVNFSKRKVTDFVIENGVTVSRPASPVTGQFYFDTTINKPIWYNGNNWVDSAGTSV